MGQREPERFGDHLRGRGRTHELTTAAGRGTGSTPHLRSVFQRDLLLGKPRADSLNLARVLSILRQ
jgi:hypothetical protein